MMTDKNETRSHPILKQILIFVCAFVILLLIGFHKELNAWVTLVVSPILRPVVLGLVLAYIINPIFRLFERRVLYRLPLSGLRRALSLLISYVLAFACVALIVWIILPQLFNTLSTFIANYQMHVDNLIAATNGTIDYINHTIGNFFHVGNLLDHFDGTKFFAFFGNLLQEIPELIDVSNLTSTASGFVSIFADSIFALFISIYLLSSKEKRYAQIMKLRRAIFSDVVNQRITKVCTSANTLFGKFAEGRLLDALIVGALTYIAALVFRIPYAIMIASFIALLNIIPIIGFWIGAVPSALIVLLTDSDKCLPFILIAFIIYQIDINIITPRILGYNTGVSALCVIISICTMGSLFGIIGMIIAVPLFATVWDVFNSFIHRRLQKLRCPDDVENYYAPDLIIDPIHASMGGTGRLIMRLEKKVLHINSLIDRGHTDKLTKRDRYLLSVYGFCRKFRLLPSMPTNVLTQFSADNAELTILEESKLLLKQKRAAIQAAKRQAEQTEGGAKA